MAVWCRCPAHHTTTGDRNEQAQRGNAAGVRYYETEDDAHIPPMVAIHDQLEILVAVACSCHEDHVRLRTFVTPAPKAPPPHLLLPPPNPFDINSDSQTTEGDSDDDGN